MPRKGQHLSDEARSKIAKALTGRSFSEETKEKLRIARSNRIITQETRDRVSKSLRGRPVSEETRKKKSLILMGRKPTEETRERMSKAKKKFLLENPDRCLKSLPTVTRPRAEIAFEKAMLMSGIKDWVTEYRIHPYRCDFAFPSLKVAVEIDGRGHKYREEHDVKRDAYIVAQGWLVIRFSNKRVNSDPSGCINELLAALISNAKKKPGQ